MALDILDIDFSGTTDGSGNLTIRQTASAAYWCSLKVVAQVPGTPVWVVQVNGRAVTFGRGSRVDLGPVLVQPKDQVMIQVIGAQVSSTMTGKLLGITGQLQDVLTNFAPVPNTIAVDTSAPELYLGRVTAPGTGASGSSTFVLPPNTYALALLASGTVGGAHISDVNVTGAISHNTYANINSTVFPGGLPNDVIYVPIGTAVFDTSVTVAFDVSAAGGQPFLDVVAMLAPIAIAATIAGIGTTPIPSAGQDTSNPSQQSIPVVPAQFYKPAPWQAAASMIAGTFAVAAGTDHTLVAGVGAQSIYVFDLAINHNGNVAYQGSLWDGASAGGVQRGELRMPAADTPMQHLVGAGAVGASSGNPLVWRPDAEQAGATTYFTLAYTQQ